LLHAARNERAVERRQKRETTKQELPRDASKKGNVMISILLGESFRFPIRLSHTLRLPCTGRKISDTRKLLRIIGKGIAPTFSLSAMMSSGDWISEYYSRSVWQQAGRYRFAYHENARERNNKAGECASIARRTAEIRDAGDVGPPSRRPFEISRSATDAEGGART